MKLYLTLFLSLFLMANTALAQKKSSTVENNSNNSSEDELVEIKIPTQSEKLEELALNIIQEEKLLVDLKKGVEPGGDDVENTKRIENKVQNLRILNKSFEQIAVKGINLDIFDEVEEPKNWQEELTLVIKPLLENLRSLTEKPRKRETLKQTIALQKTTVEAARLGLASIDGIIEQDNKNQATLKQLSKVKEKWQSLLNDAQRKEELASIELSNIDGEKQNWFESFKSSISDFTKDRGLTLFIALLVTMLIVLFFKGVTKFIDYRRAKKKTASNRTAYRIVVYAQKLMTILFVLVGILIVFFIRGDVLLLALMSILIVASALGLRHFIPRFIEESKILLNIGSVREQEVVDINGVPWRVASINVFSKLVNPELKGVLRVSLDEMKSMTSRKIADEKWFPSSTGDWVLDNDNRLYEVVGQGPHAVELQSAQGSNKLVPSSDYYAAGFVNLTKSNGIRITGVFGVDYSLQKICLDVIPQKMQAAVQKHLEQVVVDSHEISVSVDFREANASSLDYLIVVNVDSTAANQYYKISRYIQQACVEVCNQEDWTIPFPQLTVSKATD